MRLGKRDSVVVWAAGIVMLAINAVSAQPLPPAPVPPQNPVTEPKRVLGKMLFWDEQLSTDGTMSCGTCHIPARGGTDPRTARHPGPDRLINTIDDIIGSPGMIAADNAGRYAPADLFGLAPQITNRAANSVINAAYAPELFWDGRSRGPFIDPLTGQTRIPVGGALERQILEPPVSAVEMAHADRDWAQIADAMRNVRPMALATDLPPDIVSALASRPNYPALFAAAFDTPEITPTRIAFAIAAYQRTLIADQTPWDAFISGTPGAMTPQQVQGWQAFQASSCAVCHTPPQFTNHSFRNIGVRPPGEDLGRQLVTGNSIDRGRFKVPGLRNTGLKRTYMHNGQFADLPSVVAFYARAPGAPQQFPDNRDPIMNQVNVPPNVAPALTEFLRTALTDPRVAAETFPFDRPRLYSERDADRPAILGGAVAGTGGVLPRMIANAPSAVGNQGFRVGLDRALGGAVAELRMSRLPPVNGGLVQASTLETTVVQGSDPGQGYATAFVPLPVQSYRAGDTLYLQWAINDPGAPGALAWSPIARVSVFCGGTGCPSACPADHDGDGAVAAADVTSFLTQWFRDRAMSAAMADFDGSGVTNAADITAFLSAWFDARAAGC